MSLRSFLLITAVTAPLVGCGGNSNKGPGTTCGAGTMLEDGMCIGSAGVTCGSNTTLMDGMCVGTAPTPTTCGPGTTLQNGACVVDLAAPPPVTGLTATAAGTAVTVSWTASSGAAGYVVARLVAGAYDAPAQLTAYTTGQMLPGGATVIATGTATTATDTVATPGRYAYMVWPVSGSSVYGFPREAATVVTVPAQTGALSIDVANAAATVTTQPANVALAAANVAYDAETSTLTFDLTATQNTGGQLFNVKAIFGAPSSGTVSAPSGTDDAGDPFVQLALGAVLPGTAAENTITLTGVGATDTVTLPVTIAESGVGVVGGSLVDLAGGAGVQMQLPALRGRGETASIFTGGLFDASGRYYYGVSRWTTGVYRVDVATGDVAAVPMLAAVAGGSCLVVGDDGFGYAVFGLDSHRSQSAQRLAIAKLDLATLTPLAVTTLIPPDPAVAHGCALHGTTLAMGWGNGVYLADTATMAFTDADTTSADVIDPVVTTTGEAVQRLVFSPDGATIYVSKQRSPQIDAIDVATLAASSYHTAADAIWGMTIDAAGTLWWGDSGTAPGGEGSGASPGGLVSFDGTTETAVPNLALPVKAIGPWSGTSVTVATSDGQLFSVDVTTGTTTHQGTLSTDRMGHEFAAYLTP